MDARMGFANFETQGKVLGKDTASSSWYRACPLLLVTNREFAQVAMSYAHSPIPSLI